MVSNFSGGVSPIFQGGCGLQFFGGRGCGLQFFGRGVSNFSGGLQFGGVSPIFRGGSLEYGQRSAGTHPTGMHSC